MNDNIDDTGKGIMSVIVRCIGLFILLVGVYVALQVMLKAIELYEEPRAIERFAAAIEKGSNIDKSLSSIRKSVAGDPASETADAAASKASAESPVTIQSQPSPGNDVRVSYFFAWIIALLLLMLTGSISLRAIKTGGELVLYDLQIKQFAKMLVKESSKARN